MKIQTGAAVFSYFVNKELADSGKKNYSRARALSLEASSCTKKIFLSIRSRRPITCSFDRSIKRNGGQLTDDRQ